MDSPLPSIILRNDSKQSYQCLVKTTTGYVAVRSYDGTQTAFPTDGKTPIIISPSRKIALWSCVASKRLDEFGQIEQAGDIIELDCSNNQLRDIDITGSRSLRKLNCSKNLLRRLVCSGNPKLDFSFKGPKESLGEVDCSHNNLTFLDVSYLPNLSKLDCSRNKLETLKLGEKLSRLKTINCSNNRLSIVNLAGLVALEHWNAEKNKFISQST